MGFFIKHFTQAVVFNFGKTGENPDSFSVWHFFILPLDQILYRIVCPGLFKRLPVPKMKFWWQFWIALFMKFEGLQLPLWAKMPPSWRKLTLKKSCPKIWCQNEEKTRHFAPKGANQHPMTNWEQQTQFWRYSESWYRFRKLERFYLLHFTPFFEVGCLLHGEKLWWSRNRKFGCKFALLGANLHPNLKPFLTMKESL